MAHSDGGISEARGHFDEMENELQNQDDMRVPDQHSEHGGGVSEASYNLQQMSVSQDNLAPQNSDTSVKPIRKPIR